MGVGDFRSCFCRGIRFFRWIGFGHPAALNLVVSQGSVDAFPEICISDGLNGSEVFPGEIVFSPFRQTIPQSAKYITAACHQCDTARLFERF